MSASVAFHVLGGGHLGEVTSVSAIQLQPAGDAGPTALSALAPDSHLYSVGADRVVRRWDARTPTQDGQKTSAFAQDISEICVVGEQHTVLLGEDRVGMIDWRKASKGSVASVHHSTCLKHYRTVPTAVDVPADDDEDVAAGPSDDVEEDSAEEGSEDGEEGEFISIDCRAAQRFGMLDGSTPLAVADDEGRVLFLHPVTLQPFGADVAAADAPRRRRYRRYCGGGHVLGVGVSFMGRVTGASGAQPVAVGCVSMDGEFGVFSTLTSRRVCHASVGNAPKAEAAQQQKPPMPSNLDMMALTAAGAVARGVIGRGDGTFSVVDIDVDGAPQDGASAGHPRWVAQTVLEAPGHQANGLIGAWWGNVGATDVITAASSGEIFIWDIDESATVANDGNEEEASDALPCKFSLDLREDVPIAQYRPGRVPLPTGGKKAAAKEPSVVYPLPSISSLCPFGDVGGVASRLLIGDSAGRVILAQIRA